MDDRLTPEREAEIRTHEWVTHGATRSLFADLLRELDAVRAERDEVLKQFNAETLAQVLAAVGQIARAAEARASQLEAALREVLPLAKLYGSVSPNPFNPAWIENAEAALAASPAPMHERGR